MSEIGIENAEGIDAWGDSRRTATPSFRPFALAIFHNFRERLSSLRIVACVVGETIRIYFGVGGPNESSSFHVIGEIFDKAYERGSFAMPPMVDVATISVPPGGGAVAELTLEVPGEFVLVDHALSRAARGLVGKLIVEGPEEPAIFDAASVSEPVRRESNDGHAAH
jgi:nitrite reductase (NO-forming)